MIVLLNNTPQYIIRVLRFCTLIYFFDSQGGSCRWLAFYVWITVSAKKSSWCSIEEKVTYIFGGLRMSKVTANIYFMWIPLITENSCGLYGQSISAHFMIKSQQDRYNVLNDLFALRIVGFDGLILHFSPQVNAFYRNNTKMYYIWSNSQVQDNKILEGLLYRAFQMGRSWTSISVMMQRLFLIRQ